MDQETSPELLRTAEKETSAAATVWMPYIIALALGAVAITAAFYGTASEMIRVWWISVAFQHCWLIPVVVGYLIWDRRGELKQLQPRSWLPGLVAMLAAALLWLLGWAANVNFVQEFGYVTMLQGLVLTTLGPTVARAMLFPLAFMLFAVPFGEEFVPFLQKITAFLSIGLLKLSGLPFTSDGVFISVFTGIPGDSHNFEIAEECSGIRYMTAMAATATLFANIGFKSWRRRALLLAIAFVVPIIANGIRAFGIIYIAHTSDMKYAVGVDHILYGWFFFGMVMALVIFIGYRFMDKPLDAPAIDVAPLVALDSNITTRRPFWLGALVASSVAALVSFYAMRSDAELVADNQLSLRAPQLSGWGTTDLTSSEWTPVYEGATETFKHTYIDTQGHVVTLFIAVYARQDASREMVRFGNGPSGGEMGWTWASDIQAPKLPASPSPHAFQINGSGAVRDVYQWYWVNGKIVTSDSSAKIEAAKARLFYGEQRSATIILSAERIGTAPETDGLMRFSKDMGSVDNFLHQLISEK